MKSIILTLASLLISCASIWGQQEERLPYYVMMNGHFQLGIPLEGMRNDLTKTAVGGGGNLLFQLGRGRPFFAGFELSSQGYDTEELEYTSFAEGIAEDYRLRTKNSIFLWHGVFRFKPFSGAAFQPYVDGILGAKTFFTRTKLFYLIDGDEEDLVEDYTDRSETALSYGLAAGVHILLDPQGIVALDIRCAYLAGPNATYMVRKEEDTGPYDDPVEAFERATSPTTMLFPQIGITFQFSSSTAEYD